MRKIQLILFKVVRISLLMLITISCNKHSRDKTLFRLVSGKESGITFVNELHESINENMLFFSNYYTGSGVGIIDINKDGLPDVFLGGNQVSSRLYLNLGGLKFRDITESAGIKTDRWITGVSVVDINGDGFDDLYLSVSGFVNYRDTRNLFFINNGDNTFSEEASKYGLDEKAQTTLTAFFDYDCDGDLDAYMGINPSDYGLYFMGRKTRPKLNGEAASTDKLFENLGNGRFRDVSKEAGILIEGYTLGLNTGDFNSDGLPDVFVSNDFIQNDILYINQGDGTFVNQLKSSFDLTSYASMGTDAADINNDGWIDLITLDMVPEDSYREKMIVPTSSYNYYQHTLSLGYHPQFSRNVLQLNNGDGTFSEIGRLAGVSRTDWSWSALFADLDNDGFKDLFVTNGFRRELGNLDYIVYNEHSPFTNPGAEIENQINQINNTPGIPVPNYAFKNKGDLSFEKKMETWGFDLPSFSSGAATADLDLDGDLDLVINNIDMEAFLYENKLYDSNENEENSLPHYLKANLTGSPQNPRGYGAKVFVHCSEGTLMVEQNPFRGYLSSVSQTLHFGLGQNDRIDSLVIHWPDGSVQSHYNLKADSTYAFHQEESSGLHKSIIVPQGESSLFEEATLQTGIDFEHLENDQVDFHKQILLPHQHSRLGPGIAVGDANDDGLDDCFIGGAKDQPGSLYLQRSDGRFTISGVAFDPEFEDMGALFLDVDQDGDNDLYVASGGTHSNFVAERFQDRLYLNDGKGNFTRAKNNLPMMHSSSSSVNAADFDGDGDLDLFIGGRVVPGKYPLTPESYLLLNEGGFFTDATDEKAPGLKNIGMVSQGLWTDYDNDLDPDLMVVGEWMPVSIFENRNGTLVNVTAELGLERSTGWWNSIIATDLNGDGRTDYTLGNLGDNNDYNANESHPLVLLSKDFDLNGSLDPVLFREFADGTNAVPSRDALLSQLSYKKPEFPSYQSYAERKGLTIFSAVEQEGALKKEACHLENMVLFNFGRDSLSLVSLDNELQLSPIFGGIASDLDRDGVQELLLSGNFYSSNVIDGPYSGSTGVIVGWKDGMMWHRRGHQLSIPLRGDRKSMSVVQAATGNQLVVSSRNNGKVSVHKILSTNEYFRCEDNEFLVQIKLKNGRIITREIYYGSGYLSQSSRFIELPTDWASITLVSYAGHERTIVSSH